MQTTELESTSTHSSRWYDLPLYLVGGFGVLLLASLLLSQVSTPGTLVDTGLRFLINLVSLGGCVALFGVRRGKISWQSIGFAPPVWKGSWFIAAAGLTLVFLPARGILGLAASLLLEGGMDSLAMRSNAFTAGGSFTWVGFIFTLVFGGLLIPIAEELYFRGLIHTWFRERLPFWPAVTLSSVIFGLGHFDSLGVAASSFVMGMVNAVGFEKNRSIWFPIAIHAINNTFALALVNLALLSPIG
jgi:membrane protease YdiL (CAAX protease family)